MGTKLCIWLKYFWHLVFHCKCCKYCDVCDKCGCKSLCEHTVGLQCHDDDVEAGMLETSPISSIAASVNEKQILVHELEQKKKELAEASTEIKFGQGQISDLKKRLNEVTLKLSAEMSSKVSSNESSVENVNIKNRPMNVAEEYQLMCSNEWLEAKTVIDECVKGEDVPEYTRVSLLLEIIRVTEMKVKEEFIAIQSQIEALLSTLCDPLNDKSKDSGIEKSHSRSSASNTLSITNSIGDFMRLHADTISYGKIIEVIHTTLDTHLTQINPSQCLSLWQLCKCNIAIQIYIQKTANVVWKMAVQRPPMAFKFANSYESEKYQELHWSSVHIPNPVVFEVYPILYHSTAVMAKGKVLLVDPKDVQMYTTSQ